MTREQKDKILKLMAEERNEYARECEKRITAEQGKIIGAGYMLQRFIDILKAEIEPEDEEYETVDLGNGLFEKRYLKKKER